jgi:hypothetical protein
VSECRRILNTPLGEDEIVGFWRINWVTVYEQRSIIAISVETRSFDRAFGRR